MNARLCVRLALLIFISYVGCSSSLYADEVTLSAETLSTDKRWDIKRQVMSKPGVMFDMANMTDNGYTWKNDVVWEGEALPTNEVWYTAGFFFERVGSKGVWLQYAFQIDEPTGSLSGFKRSYGAGAFR